MQNTDLLSGWDTMVFMVPFLAIMALGMFRLDERLASTKDARRARRTFCGLDGNGQPILSDPDGRPWQKGSVRQIEASLRPTN